MFRLAGVEDGRDAPPMAHDYDYDKEPDMDRARELGKLRPKAIGEVWSKGE
jgi:hypothetical protein